MDDKAVTFSSSDTETVPFADAISPLLLLLLSLSRARAICYGERSVTVSVGVFETNISALGRRKGLGTRKGNRGNEFAGFRGRSVEI